MAGDASGSDEGRNGGRADPDGPTADSSIREPADPSPTDAGKSARDRFDDDTDRFPVDLEDDTDDEADDAVGPEPNSAVVEPGDPSLENALFVLLGAIAMTVVLVRVLFLVV